MLIVPVFQYKKPFAYRKDIIKVSFFVHDKASRLFHTRGGTEHCYNDIRKYK
ncbi:protein of unknown function [Legionella fallonii LLAP-10]|uniref:Uncharacterized protein n=1 Tax=Legionella fallonii LLAP-10 TaxID=1212491 RepID=A0A098GA57_9GAMM|nr:protein of unknown function [Legionella fallonii LLAP-10]